MYEYGLAQVCLGRGKPKEAGRHLDAALAAPARREEHKKRHETRRRGAWKKRRTYLPA